MLNRSASLVMSTSVLKALPGKLDIKRHSPSIFYVLGKFESVSFLDHYYKQLMCRTYLYVAQEYYISTGSLYYSEILFTYHIQ